jgi:PhnB protein
MSDHLTPYIAVPDSWAALRWYVDVLGAEPEGEPLVMEDGSVGHAEVRLDGALLMFADSAPAYDSLAPDPSLPAAVTLHLTVDDVDALVSRIGASGGRVDREPADSPFGRIAVVRDPFGHRWMLNQPF